MNFAVFGIVAFASALLVWAQQKRMQKLKLAHAKAVRGRATRG